MTGKESKDAGNNAQMNPSNESKDMHDTIVRKELDAAVNSLKKRIDNLKGVDVKFPKKPNPFDRDHR